MDEPPELAFIPFLELDFYVQLSLEGQVEELLAGLVVTLLNELVCVGHQWRHFGRHALFELVVELVAHQIEDHRERGLEAFIHYRGFVSWSQSIHFEPHLTAGSVASGSMRRLLLV